MKKFAVAFLLSLIVAYGAPAQSFVGFRHRNVPPGKKISNGLISDGGAIVLNADGSLTDFMIAEYHLGRTKHLWLEKRTDNDPNEPEFMVLHALRFPNFPRNQRFSIGVTGECTVRGREEPKLVVLVRDQLVGGRLPILKAWRANLVRKKFDAIALSGIECQPLD